MFEYNYYEPSDYNNVMIIPMVLAYEQGPVGFLE